MEPNGMMTARRLTCQSAPSNLDPLWSSLDRVGRLCYEVTNSSEETLARRALRRALW